MAGVNKVILLGRLGKDPEVRNTGNSTVANFSIATSEKFKDKATGESKEQTEWHNIVAWGSTAEIAQKYLHKGDNVFIEGKLKTRSWEKDGITRYSTEILVSNLTLLGGNTSGGGTQGPANRPSGDTSPSTSAYNNDDLPF